MPTIRRRCPRHGTTYTPPDRCPACVRLWRAATDAQRPSARRRGYTREHDKLRRLVLERDGFRCHWCGAPAQLADHVVPLALGGETTLENLVAACRRCNARRATRR